MPNLLKRSPNLSTQTHWHLKEALACWSSLLHLGNRMRFCLDNQMPNDAAKWPRERRSSDGCIHCTWVHHWKAAKKNPARGAEARKTLLRLVTPVNVRNVVNCRTFAFYNQVFTFYKVVKWQSRKTILPWFNPFPTWDGIEAVSMISFIKFLNVKCLSLWTGTRI